MPISMACVGKYIFLHPALLRRKCCLEDDHLSLLTLWRQYDSVYREVLTYPVENDQLFPDEVREAGRAHLEEKQIKHEVKVYAGVPHGKLVEVQAFSRTGSP